MTTRLESGLKRLKTASHGPSVMDYAAGLLGRLEGMSRGIYAQVVDKLDAPRPQALAGKIEEDDKFAAKQALKVVRFEAKTRDLFAALSSGWRQVQIDYYRSLWPEFSRIFSASAPSWARLDIKITKSEVASITDIVQGMAMVDHIRWLLDKTLFRVQSIAQKAYKPMPKKKLDYKATYKEALKGAMDGMMRSIEGLLRGLFEATYEQAQNRFLAVING
jgi:hypothetical protein